MLRGARQVATATALSTVRRTGVAPAAASLPAAARLPQLCSAAVSGSRSAASSARAAAAASGSAGVAAPPPGTRAAAIAQAALDGTLNREMYQEEVAAAASTGQAGAAIPANPYQPRVQYSEQWWTAAGNPKEHTFSTAGRWYSLGTGEDVTRVFPDGLAGDIVEDFLVTNSSAMLVRPLGVSLVQHLEHWRQSHGRALAAGKAGGGGSGSSKAARVLDIDPASAYTPAALQAPVPRDQLFSGGPGASAGSSGSSASAASASASASAAAKEQLATDPQGAAFQPARVLTGPAGVGKSAVLNYVVHYARSNDWLVLFVPHTFELMRMGKVLVPSKRRKDPVSGLPMMDQHDHAVRILQEFLRASDGLLRKVPQRRQYAAFRYLPHARDVTVSAQREALRASEEAERARLKAQAEAAGKTWDPASFVSKYEDESDTGVDRSTFTLADMVSWGLAHPAAATDTLLDLLQELKLVTEFPVLIAVDGHNLVYERSPYPHDSALLPAERLSIPAALQCYGADGFKPECTLTRGLWLSAVSFKHTQRTAGAGMFSRAAVPHACRTSVPPLTRTELHAQLSLYHATGRFFMLESLPAIDAFAVEYYKQLTAGLPAQVYKAAIYTP